MAEGKSSYLKDGALVKLRLKDFGTVYSCTFGYHYNSVIPDGVAEKPDDALPGAHPQNCCGLAS